MHPRDRYGEPAQFLPHLPYCFKKKGNAPHKIGDYHTTTSIYTTAVNGMM